MLRRIRYFKRVHLNIVEKKGHYINSLFFQAKKKTMKLNQKSDFMLLQIYAK
jgi:hypothetical protein